MPDSEPVKLLGDKYPSSHECYPHEFTTYKYREKEGMKKRVIDYCFHVHAKHVGALSMPAGSDIDEYMGNPCKNHPSDHYSLVNDYII